MAGKRDGLNPLLSLVLLPPHNTLLTLLSSQTPFPPGTISSYSLLLACWVCLPKVATMPPLHTMKAKDAVYISEDLAFWQTAVRQVADHKVRKALRAVKLSQKMDRAASQYRKALIAVAEATKEANMRASLTIKKKQRHDDAYNHLGEKHMRLLANFERLKDENKRLKDENERLEDGNDLIRGGPGIRYRKTSR